MACYVVRRSIDTEYCFEAVDDEAARKVAKEKREEWKLPGYRYGPEVTLLEIKIRIVDLKIS
jgi:hypothetical protein